MEVYFDKQNIVSYIHSAHNPKFDECNTMLMNKCDIFLNFNKEDLIDENDEDNSDIKLWMSENVDGFNSTWTWNANFPPRPLKSTICNDLTKEKLSAIYLLNDEKIGLVENMGLLYFSKPSEEINVLSKLWFKDLQYTRNVFNEIQAWDELTKYSSPCSDIVIFDPYIFSDEILYEVNIYRIISNLCEHASEAKINIVIFSLKEIYCKTTGQTIIPDWENIIKSIQTVVNSLVGKKPNVTIITGSKENLGEHDRTIFTNYKLFASGDTFNYFNSSGKRITKGRYLNVYSLVDENNYDNAMDFISDMQNIYNHINSINKDLIHKDKNSKSNFLNII